MKKKLLSLLLSLVLLVTLLAPAASASAATSYVNQLINAGFPKSYAEKLVKIHNKYPKWKFVPFQTGMSLSYAVSGERTNHKNQIVEPGYKSKYYCTCSKCKGRKVAGCYCASAYAVQYYMDPRNWLDEQHLFQFEDNRYNSAHTAAGVERIIASTWMANSYITYKNTEGKTVTYTNGNGTKVKYSDAIMEAAKKANMSAYYIASRIVKEVGNKKPTASGVVGTKSPFNGIYNYYSIGAGGGGMAGVEWASGWLMALKSTKLYSTYNAKTKKAGGTATSVSSGQRMSYIGTYGNYFKVKLYSGSYSTSGKVGYMLKSAVRTTYCNYNRPWTSPYKSIIGGAQFISDGYLKYQFTGYFEKFNVNRSSGHLYSHEYMQNVNAPSKESVSRYKAYEKSGQLANAKVFYIPVFSDMGAKVVPNNTTQVSTTESVSTTAASGTASKVEKIEFTEINPTNLKLKWNAVKGATQYNVKIYNNTKGTTFSKTIKTNNTQLNNLTTGNLYKVSISARVGKKWTAYSKQAEARCVPSRVTINTMRTLKKRHLGLIWKKAAGAQGYQIQVSTDKNFKKNVTTVAVKKTALGYKFNKMTSGKTYYARIRAFVKIGNKKFYGKYSTVKSVKVK